MTSRLTMSQSARERVETAAHDNFTAVLIRKICDCLDGYASIQTVIPVTLTVEGVAHRLDLGRQHFCESRALPGLKPQLEITAEGEMLLRGLIREHWVGLCIASSETKATNTFLVADHSERAWMGAEVRSQSGDYDMLFERSDFVLAEPGGHKK